MKKLLLTLAAIPAATMAVEASAQTYVGANANVTVQNQIVQLQNQLNIGIQNGAIDATEARRLRQEIRRLTRLRTQYSANGLTTQEWRVLQQQVGNISQQMQVAAGYAAGNPPYGNAYGYYGNQGYPSQGYPSQGYSNQGYAYDQYGRPVAVNNGGYYGQGGPYVPAPQARSNGIGNVLGGVLGSVVGGGGVLGNVLGGGGLGIGSVITGAIANALGGGDRYGYQDRSNVYFRTDGERVYEIDARTNQVIRIHPAR